MFCLHDKAPLARLQARWGSYKSGCTTPVPGIPGFLCFLVIKNFIRPLKLNELLRSRLVAWLLVWMLLEYQPSITLRAHNALYLAVLVDSVLKQVCATKKQADSSAKQAQPTFLISSLVLSKVKPNTRYGFSSGFQSPIFGICKIASRYGKLCEPY